MAQHLPPIGDISDAQWAADALAGRGGRLARKLRRFPAWIDENFVVHLATDWPEDMPRPSQLRLENRYQLTLSVNWFYLHSQEGLTFQRPQQQGGLLDLEFGSAQEDGLAYWESGVPAISGGEQQTDVPALAADLIGQEGNDGRPLRLS